MSEGQENLGLDEQQAGRVEEYKFEPIKGYPMLNWRGKRPFTSTQFYPAQLKEVHGEEVDGWRNKIFWGDNLQTMSHLLKDFRGQVDAIYIDPPFDSGADYKKKIRTKSGSAQSDATSFEEKQYTDIWTNDEYLQYMYCRLVLLKELLAPTGSIALHCDDTKSHLLRCLMDEVFGANNFVNEIVWHYRRWSNVSNTFQKMHDTIFIYGKTKDRFFNLLYQDYANPDWIEDTVRGFVDGKLVRLKDEDGNYLKRETENQGVPMHDVWEDINFIAPTSSERLGYPTQKPVALAERIVETICPPGGIILDAFMGSGTVPEAAMNLDRRYLAIDINVGAIQTATKRLLQHAQGHEGAAGFEFYNVNNYDLFRNPLHAKALLLEALEVQSLDGHTVYDGEKDGRMVKIMPVNRIATKADLGELVSGFDQKAFQRRQDEKPNQPVEKILLVCMGHQPDLKAQLELEAQPFKVDVEVVDILRDKSQLEFKRDAEAKLSIKSGELIIENFYPMNLLQKLSLQQEQVAEWRELVDSVMVDWNYDGAILQPAVVDVPEKNELVLGRYTVPADAGTIRVKITDLLSESWEGEIDG